MAGNKTRESGSGSPARVCGSGSTAVPLYPSHVRSSQPLTQLMHWHEGHRSLEVWHTSIQFWSVGAVVHQTGKRKLYIVDHLCIFLRSPAVVTDDFNTADLVETNAVINVFVYWLFCRLFKMCLPTCHEMQWSDTFEFLRTNDKNCRFSSLTSVTKWMLAACFFFPFFATYALLLELKLKLINQAVSWAQPHTHFIPQPRHDIPWPFNGKLYVTKDYDCAIQFFFPH